MKLLIFRVGESTCALDGSLVRHILQRDEGEEGLSCDLAPLFPGSAARWDTRLRLEVEGRPLDLRITTPDGFREVGAGELLPLPPFLFEGGKRPVRAVFLDSGRVCLLLDERELARRAGTACS